MFENSFDNKRYYTLNCFYRRFFGGRVFKVPIDGGFTCPNIDGKCGRGGCIYCNRLPLSTRGMSVREQFDKNRKPLEAKWLKNGENPMYIPYFQMFSNTYGDTEYLRRIYYEALDNENVVGLDIATRADCLNKENVALLREINEKTFLTVELGLQTSNDKTAERINRGHSFDDFVDGYKMLKGINTCVHIINGLPNETEDDMLKTAYDVAVLKPFEIKIHMLYIERGTEIAKQYIETPFHIMTRDEYVGVCVSQLELLPPDTVVGRLTGDGIRERIITPLWTKDKRMVLNSIDMLMTKKNTFQGTKYSEK